MEKDKKKSKVLNLYPIDYPFETLVDRIDKGKLILNPDFQRTYKWDKHGNERGSRFIESCLMRIPLPACYFAETMSGDHLVIDGVQRLTTVSRFFKDEFKLEGLTVFTELEGKKFSELGGYRQDLESTTIRCVVLRKENPEGLIQEIFARLNQGSVVLSAQEIRHAIYPGALDSLLTELSRKPEVASFKRERNAREGEELVLRFFAFNSSLNGYENMSKYLDFYMRENQNLSEEEITILRESFSSSLEKCSKIFGEHAFRNLARDRKRRSAIFWDLQMIGFLPYELNDLLKKKNLILIAFEELCRNEEFSKTLSGRLLYKSSVLKRRRLWECKLRDVMV